MELKLLHLYHDLMNLYGEGGNVRALERHLSDQGFQVTVEKKSVGEEWDFSQYAVTYIGSGTERNQKVALNDLKRYRAEIAQQMEQGAVFILTGNAFEIMGARIVGVDQSDYEGLGIAGFEVRENPQKRYTGDAVCVSDWYAKPMIGFINKCSEITGVDRPLFDMKLGEGNAPGDSKEGFQYNNVFGTHLTGPALIKNPHLMEHMVKVIGSQFEGFQMKKINYDTEMKAYRVTLAELMQRVENVK